MCWTGGWLFWGDQLNRFHKQTDSSEQLEEKVISFGKLEANSLDKMEKLEEYIGSALKLKEAERVGPQYEIWSPT